MAPNPPSFEQRVVVITGATAGLGLALARAFRAAGALVVGTGRDQAALHRLAGEFSLTLTLDVTEPAHASFAADAVLDRYGRVDVLVNNAGAGWFAPLDRTDEAALKSMMDLNFFGPVRVANAFLPAMRAAGRGALVQVTSVAGIAGFADQSAYCASKHALMGWSRAARVELAGSGVSVLCVCPPVVKTGFFAKAGRPERLDAHRGRVLEPERVADATLRALARGDQELLLSPGSVLSAFTQALIPLKGLLRSAYE